MLQMPTLEKEPSTEINQTMSEDLTHINKTTTNVNDWCWNQLFSPLAYIKPTFLKGNFKSFHILLTHSTEQELENPKLNDSTSPKRIFSHKENVATRNIYKAHSYDFDYNRYVLYFAIHKENTLYHYGYPPTPSSLKCNLYDPPKENLACGRHLNPTKGEQAGLPRRLLSVFTSPDLISSSLHLHDGQCSELPHVQGMSSELGQPSSALKIRQKISIVGDPPHPTARAQTPPAVKFWFQSRGEKRFATVTSGGDFYFTLSRSLPRTVSLSLCLIADSKFYANYFSNNKYKNIFKVNLNTE